LAATAGANLLPKTKAGLAALLEAFLLDQAVIEMSRELQRQSDIIRVPLEGLLQILART
jgi:predicted trehalose synthase